LTRKAEAERGKRQFEASFVGYDWELFTLVAE
jgi:hypothetical protein